MPETASDLKEGSNMTVNDQTKAEIFQQYQNKVLRYFNSKLTDSYLAEDLCADVFLKVYEKLDTFDESKASLSTWIFTVARNTLTDYFRTRRVYEEVPEDLSAGSDIEEEVCNEEQLETLADALEALDERERDIIIFHYYSGMTLTAIAERMSISYAYVKVLHNKALSHMKKFF